MCDVGVTEHSYEGVSRSRRYCADSDNFGAGDRGDGVHDCRGVTLACDDD